MYIEQSIRTITVLMDFAWGEFYESIQKREIVFHSDDHCDGSIGYSGDNQEQ